MIDPNPRWHLALALGWIVLAFLFIFAPVDPGVGWAVFLASTLAVYDVLTFLRKDG